MRLNSKFARAVVVSLFILTSTFSTPSANALQKLPLLDLSTGFQISDASEVIGFARNRENWVIAGINNENKSWVAQYTEKGEQLWRIFPVTEGGGGEGFITALVVDGQGVVVAGVSQNQVLVRKNEIAEGVPTPSVSPTLNPTSAPTPSASPSPTRNVPLVNPDNVIPGTSEPLRGSIKNIFIVRIDNGGKVLTSFNVENARDFIPSSLATRNSSYFMVGNEVSADNQSRGALFIFKSDSSINSFSYGVKQTAFKKVIVNSANSLTVVGSSADTLAERAVVGRADGVILTISQASGAITKVLRSSGKGATRSWDFASGNLLVSGTSRTRSTREAVVTFFTSKAVVSWTSRFPRSVQALAYGNCIAVESAESEVLVYTVDSKGKQSKGARIPSQDLISLATTPAKGCAVLTASPLGEFRVSYR